jgi:SAM-dependent methyltransferase
MKKYLKKINKLFCMFGFNPRRFVYCMLGLPAIFKDYSKIKRQIRDAHISIKTSLNMPCPQDKFKKAGTCKGHYFNQDLLIAEKIAVKKPERHVDIGSSVYGFVSHVAAFRNIEIFDIRPLEIDVFPQIKFIQCDMMKPLPDFLREYSDSVSCLHALEHFGLGRYGDPVNINGSIQGFRNMAHIVKPGGTLYVSVPIGSERIEFNGHRVFAIQSIIKMGENENLKLEEFSFVDDSGNLHRKVDLTDKIVNENAGCTFGCGIFEFEKKLL